MLRSRVGCVRAVVCFADGTKKTADPWTDSLKLDGDDNFVVWIRI